MNISSCLPHYPFVSFSPPSLFVLLSFTCSLLFTSFHLSHVFLVFYNLYPGVCSLVSVLHPLAVLFCFIVSFSFGCLLCSACSLMSSVFFVLCCTWFLSSILSLPCLLCSLFSSLLLCYVNQYDDCFLYNLLEKCLSVATIC